LGVGKEGKEIVETRRQEKFLLVTGLFSSRLKAGSKTIS